MTEFYTAITLVFRWSLSVGAKLARVVAGHTVAVVLASLAAQLALLLAFFLPLKVIILLGSPSIPQYFPQSLHLVNREQLVILLSASATGFYFLYLLSVRITASLTEKGAAILLERSRKISLFDNQEEISQRAYSSYTESLAGFIFIVMALVVVGALYPQLLAAVMGYFILVVIAVSLGFSFSSNFRRRLSEGYSGLVEVLAALGFLTVFVFMVGDFLSQRPPSMIKAIVSLLLVRQAMTRASSSIQNISALYVQRAQIEALFFHRHVASSADAESNNPFWRMFEEPFLTEWVTKLLEDVIRVCPGYVAFNWHQTGVIDVVAIEVTVFDDARSIQDIYLIKVFNHRRRSLAKHELTLLTGSGRGRLPAPIFLGSGQVGSFQCHIFAWGSGKKVSSREVSAKRIEVAAGLLSYEPDPGLVERYSRSRQMLALRLNKRMLDRLALAATSEQNLHYIEQFKRMLEQVKRRVGKLPYQVVNPEVKPDRVYQSKSGKVQLTQWVRWGLEPVGAGWPIDELDTGKLEQAVIYSKQVRSSMQGVEVSDIKLVALIYAIDCYYCRQNYCSALELLPLVMESLEDELESCS